MRKLLLAGASINIVDHKGNTPLHIAAKFTSTKPLEEIVKYVSIQTILEVSQVRNNEGLSCFHVAAKNGNVEIMRKLRNLGVDVDMQVSYISINAMLPVWVNSPCPRMCVSVPKHLSTTCVGAQLPPPCLETLATLWQFLKQHSYHSIRQNSITVTPALFTSCVQCISGFDESFLLFPLGLQQWQDCPPPRSWEQLFGQCPVPPGDMWGRCQQPYLFWLLPTACCGRSRGHCYCCLFGLDGSRSRTLYRWRRHSTGFGWLRSGGFFHSCSNAEPFVTSNLDFILQVLSFLTRAADLRWS